MPLSDDAVLKRVQIQTTTACGAACTMCPHPEEAPHWSNGLMDDGLFERIVCELSRYEIEYVAPYLMADPLSDRKIFDRVRRLRRALPDTTIEISTTGKYLLPALANRLLETPLTELRISSHGISAAEYARTMPGVDFDRAMANIRRFVERYHRTRPYQLYIVSMWGLWPREREAEIETFWADLGVEVVKWRVISRASQVDLSAFSDGSPDPTLWSQGRREPPWRCRHGRDTEWLHILSDGRVTLCCMDYRQSVIVGDLREQSVEEVFNGEPLRRIRDRIRGDAPMDPDFICRRCEWHVSERVYREQHQRNAEAKRGIAGIEPASPGVMEILPSCRR
jgi:MoaA/NifB/PqqE/SkfB family radical SAM enzyme